MKTLVTITDRDGFVFHARDGDVIVVQDSLEQLLMGDVFTFGSSVWFRTKDRGQVYFEYFSNLKYMSNRPKPVKRWQVGATYKGPCGYRDKLIHTHGKYMTFERHFLDGRFRNVFTTTENQLLRFEMIEAAPKDYDPTQQPYEDGDI